MPSNINIFLVYNFKTKPMSKLKALTILILLFITNHSIGQSIEKLNGYKYVFVPTLTYGNGDIDVWSISSKLRSYFSDKGFVVFSDKTPPLEDIEGNPCLLLNCIINHTNVTVGTNEVSLIIKNCKGEVVYSNTGKAMGWSMQDDYNKATKRAFGKIDDLKYNFNPQLTPQIEYTKVETTNESEQALKNYLDSAKLNTIEGIYKSYQNDKMSYYKFAIKKKDEKFIAIIIEADNKIWKPGEVKAVFEPSSMNGFYSVKWYLGDKTSVETFGMMENEALLSIEFKEQNGGKRQNKFIKMYPTSENSKATFKKSSGTSGSGFFVSTNGLIATNAHVVEGAKNIKVNISNDIGNFNYKAKLVLIDSKNDVALIQLEDDKFNGLTSLPYGISEKADIGEKSFTIGYPLNDIMGTNYKVTDGIISAKSGIADDVRYYQISIPLQPGNSGGPLFNNQGNVIGITSAKLNSKAVGTSIENVNYAIKATYLLSLMNMIPNTIIPQPSNQLLGKELKEQVKILKNYVCLIQVSE